MKTFIFFLVLIIGFFFYLFSTKNTEPQPDKITSNTLEELEELEEQSDIITRQEISSYTTLSKDIPRAIPEEQIFDTIKNLLLKASKIQYPKAITLSTKIDSFLQTPESKEEFRQNLAAAFNLNYDDVEKNFKKNKLVWDWVNQLKD